MNKRSLLHLSTLVLALTAQTISVRAADVIKADNADNLNLGSSWLGGLAPSAADVAVWNSTVTAANTTLLGTDGNWNGVRVANPAGPVTVLPNVIAAAITAVGGSPTLTYAVAPAIPLVDGGRAVLGGTVAPTNFTFGTLYYVVNATPTSFQLSATSGGIPITPTGPGAAPNVSGHIFAPGASGIDLSTAIDNLTLDVVTEVSASQAWNVGADRVLTVSTPLVGAAANVLTKNGSGTLVLSAAVNGTYAGPIVVNGGVLQLNSGNANNNSAAGTGFITNNGATLRTHAGRIVGNGIQFNGSCLMDANNLSIVWDGAWQGSGTVIVTNLIAGATFTAGGNGNGGGSGANFTGTIQLGTNAGTFRFNNGGGNNFVGNVNATFDLGTGTVSMVSRNATTINLGEVKGGPDTSLSGQSNGSGTTVWSIGAKGTSTTFEGTVKDSTTARISALTKVGAGTLTLTGTNTYTMPTTISAGTLQIGNGGTSGTLGTGPVVNNASLVINRSDELIISNAISGTGALTKLGAGTLVYGGTNSSSGTTVISQGALALDVAGFISSPISIAAGAVFDVTTNVQFVLNQSLSGSGTVVGAVTNTGGSLNPGGSGFAGTLTFANGLAQLGTVNNQLELSSPGSTNDLIAVVGDLVVTGTNSIIASRFGGGALPNGTYPLFTYTGNFDGGLTNFAVTVTGVTGTLTNPPNQIALIITPGARSATNLTWVGDGTANLWDDNVSTNWVNGAVQFKFLAGDSVRFDATGAANPTVNLAAGVLQPAAVVVDAVSDYTFTGVGNIAGATGLTKNNAGTLSVQTTNGYTGPTVINGGVLEITTVANGNSPSSIGAAGSNPTNLVFAGTTLRFNGPDSSSTDRGAMLNGAGGIFDVTGANLTFNGSPVVGAGSLVKNGPGTLTLGVPNTYAGGTVISNGILALGSNSANNDGTGGSGLGATNSPVTFRGGTLQLFGYNGGLGNNYATLYNPLIVPVGEVGTLQMFPRGPVNSGGNSGLQSSLTGGGTLNLEVNYVRDDLSGNWSAFTGLINVTAKNGADEMRINNNFGYANATIVLNDGVNLCRSFTAGTVNDIGALFGTSLAVVGQGNSSGPRPTWRVGWLNTDATYSGTIADDGSTTIIKVGTGSWTLNGFNTYTGPTIVSNGVLVLNGSLASTNISVVSGASFDVTSLGTLLLNAGQTLGGNGTVWGSVDTTSGGDIAPGFSLGTLTVTNTVTLAGTATMEVNRNGGVPLGDKLVAASISLGGTLRVVPTGAALQVGDTFDLFDGALSGSFTTLSLGYYTWNTSQLAVNGTITVTGVLPPPTLSVTTTGTDIVLSTSGGIPGGLLSVVTSTDASAPRDTWTTVQNDVYDGSGNYTLTIPIDTAAPQRFYSIRAF